MSEVEGDGDIELTVVMPCLNEARTVATCVSKALRWMAENSVKGEVVVADNGSTDGSQKLATEAGARVVDVPIKGYGSALLAGFEAARGRYIIMGDADDSYDFLSLTPFIEKLREGYQLVMGNRFRGGIDPGAMPLHHRYLGNPVLTGLGRLFFSSHCGDFHCGLRGFQRAILPQLNLRTTGMELASELVVKAELHKLKITEVPTRLAKDGRGGRAPHLNSWRDGWRHLRFLLLYSPTWLFMYPGVFLMTVGSALMLLLLPGPHRIFSVALDVHTLLYASAFILLGYQAVTFSLFARVFAVSEGLIPATPRHEAQLDKWPLEKGIILALAFMLVGITGSVLALGAWRSLGYGEMDTGSTLRLVIPSVLFLLLSGQTMMGSFFLSLLRLRRRKEP